MAGLIVELERAITAIPNAVRAFFRPRRFRPRPTDVTPVGERERVEESKYYPAVPPGELKTDQEELPDSYGQTCLVMMVVNPHLAYAYWEVGSDKLAAARKQTRGARDRAVLRFYEVEDGVPGSEPPSGWFDVDVELQPRNWYVELWSADKTYYAELGLKSDDGQLVPLARSNRIHTPRAWPVVKVEEDFMRVDPARDLAELVPPPAGGRRRNVQAAVDVPAGDGAAAVPVETGDAPSPDGPSRPFASSETLKKKLAEFFTILGRISEVPKAGEAPAQAAPDGGVREPSTDLVEMTEREFTPGISSSVARKKHPED